MEKKYLNIQGWMVDELGLRGEELMVYAIVYGFSQDGEGWFYGGRSYIQKWLGCGAKKAGRILSKLVSDGLVEKRQASGDGKPGTCYRYQAKGAKMEHLGGQNGLEVGQMDTLKWAKMTHINIKGEIKGEEKKKEGGSSAPPKKENTSDDSGCCEPSPQPNRKRFVKPTIEEVMAYIDENGYSVDAEQWYDHYEANGWMAGRNHMRDWKAAVRNWHRRSGSFGASISKAATPRNDEHLAGHNHYVPPNPDEWYRPERESTLRMLELGHVTMDDLGDYDRWVVEEGWKHGIPKP